VPHYRRELQFPAIQTRILEVVGTTLTKGVGVSTQTMGHPFLRAVLARYVDERNETQLLRWMHLIHTHQIEIAASGIAGEQDGPRIIPAIPQREAASLIASFWHDQADPERSEYMYWLREYVRRYQFNSTVPVSESTQIAAIRRMLESDPRIDSVVLASS
jgi:hypothetical protein